MAVYRTQDPLELSISVSLQDYVDHRKLFLEVLFDSDKYTLWYTDLSYTFLCIHRCSGSCFQ